MLISVLIRKSYIKWGEKKVLKIVEGNRIEKEVWNEDKDKKNEGEELVITGESVAKSGNIIWMDESGKIGSYGNTWKLGTLLDISLFP